MVNGADVVMRAQSAIGKGCRYKLGAGGRRWHQGTPWHPLTMACDCSGFVAWCLREDRYLKNNPWYRELNGGWLETSAIVRDCHSPFGLFDRVEWQDANMGDLLVWGDRGEGQGHVGVVSVAAPTGPTNVIHCSAGNYRRTGDAIQETGVKVFLDNGAIVARFAGLV